ncbi:hypothetical protein BGX38DRAFT_1207025 [Terfezia claveryi]|nr:hypothetical protein BGX38DRAFT_1207025 [Terfezia claveryi]
MSGANSSNHLENHPRPAWSVLLTHNAANGATCEPQALVSHTPVLTVRVARHSSPKRLSLYFESFPTGHLFPLVYVKSDTRTIFIKFRHSSFHRGLVSEELMREMGGPIQEQYIITHTRHEFELPDEFSTTKWSWRRFRAPNGPGPEGRGGAHVLEVIFREDLEGQAEENEMQVDN